MPLRDLILVVIVCLVWSFNFIAGAQATEHIPPFLVMVVRFLIVFLVLLPFLRLPPAGQWPRLISVCLFMGGLHFTALFWALMHSKDVSSIVISQQTYIPMAVLMAMVFLREKVGWRSLLASAMAFLGILVIGLDPMVFQQLDVLSISLLSAVFQALGSILMRGLWGISAFNFQAWTALISLPVMIAGSMLVEHDQLQILETAQWIHWGSIFYSALIASIVGHGLFFYLVQRHPVSTVMPYLMLTPLFGILFGILVWGDRPDWRLVLGGVMVLGGVLIITLRARRKSLGTS